MKFTKEEISLCEQIAEKYGKDIEYGDWFIFKEDPHCFPSVFYPEEHHTLKEVLFPLWTISDCLEFLEGKGFTYILYFYDKSSFDSEKVEKEWHKEGRGWYELSLFDSRKHENRLFMGKTRLIICLKAVLAVLEEMPDV